MTTGIRHMAGMAEIVEDVEAAVGFYRDVLGLSVKHEAEQGYAVVEIPGVLHFGIWGRAAAARSVFGDASAAERIPLGFTVGFEADSVSEASAAMSQKGWRVIQPPKQEDWGQTTSRFISPGGALCEVSETPWARRISQPVKAEAEQP